MDVTTIDSLQRLANELRKGRPFMPKGVWRFKTHEEADAWKMEMLTRRSNPASPTLADLLFLCRCLNEAGARYVVIGGWAVIQHGFERTTSDVDLLVEASLENFKRIKAAMLKLPDGAIRDVKAGGSAP